jgi:hypothetical protein
MTQNLIALAIEAVAEAVRDTETGRLFLSTPATVRVAAGGGILPEVEGAAQVIADTGRRVLVYFVATLQAIRGGTAEYAIAAEPSARLSS